MLIVREALLSQHLATLMLIQQVRGAIPQVTLSINIQRERLLPLTKREGTSILGRRRNACKADARGT